ncbi:hypothetical protein C8J56DRAFT_1067335 [Mycena floridula]|nr:hypothetical protein C8J56DRAFT_1070783 [Mycena floridula]KAJ7572990.1 hypothetical protein C8J56DRAFT_1067335 [Mycena floridula]
MSSGLWISQDLELNINHPVTWVNASNRCSFRLVLPHKFEYLEYPRGWFKSGHTARLREAYQRSVPIEVFLRDDCGWAVRSTSSIRSGEFLGFFTGDTISSESADLLPESEFHFCLHLDFNVRRNDPRWAINAAHSGNFTRFLNHSCNANLQFRPISQRRIGSNCMNYHVALWALRDIPALEELSIDYNPGQGDKDGDIECCCGSAHCRQSI